MLDKFMNTYSASVVAGVGVIMVVLFIKEVLNFAFHLNNYELTNTNPIFIAEFSPANF